MAKSRRVHVDLDPLSSLNRFFRTVSAYGLWGSDPRFADAWYPVPYTGATLLTEDQRMDRHLKDLNYPWGHFSPGVRLLHAWWKRVRPGETHYWKIVVVRQKRVIAFMPERERASVEREYWLEAGERYGWTLNLYSPSGRSTRRTAGNRRGRLERHLWEDCAGAFSDDEFDQLLRPDPGKVRELQRQHGWRIKSPVPTPDLVLTSPPYAY